MDRMREWLRRLWYLLNRRRIDAALREEMEAHQAEMATPVRFGNLRRLREEASDVWGWRWLDDLGGDLKLGLRTLRRSPGFTLIAVAILSVGIGVNLGLFQAINVTLVRPLLVKNPQTLVYFHYRARTFDSSDVPYPLAMFVRANTNALSTVLVSRSTMLAWRDLGDQLVAGEFVSTNWFDELGASVVAGRVFHEGVDDLPSEQAVVVLSRRFWERTFGGRPGVIGSTVRLNGQPAVVAGVADGQVSGGGEPVSPLFWVPIERISEFQPASQLLTDWTTQSVRMYGRLRAGTSAEAARAATQVTLSQLLTTRPDAVLPGQWLEPYSAEVRFMAPRERQQAWTMVTAVAMLTTIVLMITCLNLGNLTLARAISRVREMSIRTALGAGRWRVLRHLIVESALVACAGALGGWLLELGAASVVTSAAGLPTSVGLGLDSRMAVAVCGAALLSAVAVGLAPAWKIGRQDLALATRDGGERASFGLHAVRLRHWLVVGQIAGSCVLVVFAGQMLRGLQRALTTNQLFSIDRLAVLEPPPDSFRGAHAGAASFWEDVRAIMAAQPETDQATLVTAAPLGDGVPARRYAVAPQIWFRATSVDANFFSTLRIPIVSGRAFEPGDDEKNAVMVSKRGAVEMYGTLDVVGRGFPKGQTSPKVVGVAADARLVNIQATDMAELYWPLRPGQANAMIVRAKTDPSRLLVPLRDAARVADGRVLPAVRLMRDDFERELRTPRLASVIAAVTALLALGLACVGIFGVVSYGVGLRTKEIGIRLALGADAGSILQTLLGYTLSSGAVGVLLGLAGGWPAGRTFAGAPFYLQRLDLAAYASVGVIFVMTGIIAAFVPAWRALRRDPLRALRHE